MKLLLDENLPRKYHAAVIVLLANDNRLRTLRQLVPKVITALDLVKPGQLHEITL